MTLDIGLIGTSQALKESVLQPQNRSLARKTGN
jgi:hypothetical protein